MTYKNSEELMERRRSFMDDHIDSYLTSGGAEGHIIDLAAVGARNMLPTLLLQTIGRKSGKSLIVPLIYGCFGGEWVVIGSKGGAAEHPAWFVNLQERKEVFFQVATQCFRGTWRLPERDERSAVWNYMVHLFPPYATYQEAAGVRVIPVVMLNPIEQVPVFKPSAD
jgi:deazaflavin-dependent oxidoreductase (nitroreductase family)